MRNIVLEISYEGTRYSGWQIQKNATTVQGIIQSAVSEIVKHPVKLLGSGRTDSGVHAIGQVASFKTESSMSQDEFKRAINRLVPNDIRVVRAEAVSDDFHPRYSAKRRWYRYIISTHTDPVPFFNNYSFWVRRRLDVDLLNRYSGRLIGSHNFRNLSTMEEGEVPIRNVIECGFMRRNDFVVLDIVANSFLRKMVRSIVGTFLALEKRGEPPGMIDEILVSRERSAFVQTSYAGGLYLLKVFY
jgi:tRNA pseudouridine38-40 synthase